MSLREHLILFKLSLSQNAFALIFCLSTVAFGFDKTSQAVFGSDQETETHCTTSSSIEFSVLNGLQLLDRTASVNKIPSSTNIDNVEEKQIKDITGIQVPDENDVRSEMVPSMERDVRNVLQNVSTQQPTTTDNVGILQHGGKMPLVSDAASRPLSNNATLFSGKVQPRDNVFIMSNTVYERNGLDQNTSVLYPSSVNVSWDKEHNDNQFLLPKLKSKERLTNNTHGTMFARSILLSELPKTSNFLNDTKNVVQDLPQAHQVSEYDIKEARKEETEAFMKTINKLLFNSLNTRNLTLQHIQKDTPFTDGKENSNNFPQNINETVATVHTNNSRETAEKLSEIENKVVPAEDTSKTFSETENKVVFARDTTDKYSEIENNVVSARDTTDKYSEIKNNVVSARDTTDKYSEIENNVVSARDTTDKYSELENNVVSTRDTTNKYSEIENNVVFARDTTDTYSEIENKVISARETTNKYSEIENKVVFARDPTNKYSEIENNVVSARDTTNIYSEIENKVVSTKKTTETISETLNMPQIKRTSKLQHVELGAIDSTLGSESVKKDVSQVKELSNKSITISNKDMYMDRIHISRNRSMASPLGTRKRTTPVRESELGNIPGNSERDTKILTENLPIRLKGGAVTSPEFNTHPRNDCSVDLHSCKDRCSSTSTTFCSCHWACTLYGTCCEDINDHCPVADRQDTKMLEQLKTSSTECRDGYLLVSFCEAGFRSKHWEQLKMWASGSVHENDDSDVYWWFLYVDTGIDDIELRRRCESTDETLDLIYKVPVTDAATQVNFKNVFCAICHNITDLDFWIGLANCDIQLSNATSGDMEKARSVGSDHDIDWSVLNASSSLHRINHACQIVWLREGEGHTCLSDSIEKESTFETVSRSTESSPAARGLLNMHTRDRVTSDRKRRSASAEGGQIAVQSTNNWTHIPESGQSDLCNHTCVKSISRLPANGGIWYTIRQLPTESGPNVTPEWGVTPGIEPRYLQNILDQIKPQSLRRQSNAVSSGECSMRSVELLISTTFTFERTGLITGNFHLEVQKHTKLMTDIFLMPVSNTSLCDLVSSSYFQVDGSSYVFNNHLEIDCADSAGVSDVHLDSSANKENSRGIYTQFLNARFNMLLAQDGAMGLPVSIEYHTCIYDGFNLGTQPCSFCGVYTGTWDIQRDVNAIFGRISLEALVSIICCVLSIIGLISRLVLQRVVPFFNSYPGKVQFCLCVSLLFAYSFFLVGGSVQNGSPSCKIVAILTHLAFLSSLLWMNVTAFEIWRTFRHWSNQVMTRGMKSLVLSAVYSVGIPAVLVTAAVILDELWPWSVYSPYYGRPSCWLNGTRAVAIFFVAPCSLVSFMNVIFIALTLRGLRSQRTSISEFRKPKNNMAVTDTAIVVKIIFLVGITWLFGLLAALIDNQAIWIIFTILNASLGFFISLVLVFNRRVMAAIRKTWLSYKADSTSTCMSASVTKTGLKNEPSR